MRYAVRNRRAASHDRRYSRRHADDIGRKPIRPEARDLGPARRIHLERVAQTDLTLQRRLVLLRYGSRVC